MRAVLGLRRISRRNDPDVDGADWMGMTDKLM